MKNLLKKHITFHIILFIITMHYSSNTLAIQPHEHTIYTLHGKEYLIKTSALKNIEPKRYKISKSYSSYFNWLFVIGGCSIWGSIIGDFFILTNYPDAGKGIGAIIGGIIGKNSKSFLQEYYDIQENPIMPAYLKLEEKECFDSFIASHPNEYKK